MPLTCDNATLLVAPYLDGELSESQATDLRQHLIACAACRSLAQGGKSLSRWFVEDPALAAQGVPEGFAPRVARRAFAGDTGEHEAPASSTPEIVQGRLHTFVVALTAVAAAAVLLVAVSLRSLSIPAERGLSAEEFQGLEQTEVLKALRELNLEAEQDSLDPAVAPEDGESH